MRSNSPVKNQRSNSPTDRTRFRERVALKLLERPSSPVKLPDVVTATTRQQSPTSVPGGCGKRSLSADLFDILKNHAKGIVSRPTTTSMMSRPLTQGGMSMMTAPLRPSRTVTSGGSRGIATPDPSGDALAAALALLRDHSQTEKDFSMLCICTEDCPVFFEALSRATNCSVVNLQGAALPVVAEAMLLRAIQANPTPISEVIITGSTLAANKALPKQIAEACAARLAKRKLDDDAAYRRALAQRQQAAMAAFVTQRGLLEEKLKLVRQAIADDQTRDIRQLRRAWRVAKAVAEIEQYHRERYESFCNGARQLAESEAASRAEITRSWSDGYANVVLESHAASLARMSVIEQKERRSLWRRYCAGWLASSQLLDRRLLIGVVAQRKITVELLSEREKTAREEQELRQTMLQQRVADFNVVKRAEFEAKQRKDDERRRTRQKQTEEDQHLEHLRAKAKAESFRAPDNRGTGKGKGAGPAWAVEHEAAGRVSIEDLESLAFKLLAAARRAVERAVSREERLYDSGRHYQALLRQPGKIEFRVHRSSPYTSVFVGNRKCVPVENGLRVYLAMDPLWVVRASVLRDEVEKYWTNCKNARKESLQSISTALHEVESKFRIEKIDIHWPRAVRQFLSSGKKQLQEFAEGILFFTVPQALARKETIFSGVLEISLKDEYRELGDLIVVEKGSRPLGRKNKSKKNPNPLSVEGEEGGEGGSSGDSLSDSGTLSELSEEDENPEAALMARVQKNFMRHGPRHLSTWSRVTEGDTSETMQVRALTPVSVSSSTSFTIENDDGDDDDKKKGPSKELSVPRVDAPPPPGTVFLSPGEVARSRSKAVRFSIPTQASALDIEDAIRSVRFALLPAAEDHFRLSPSTFEIGIIDVRIKVFTISHKTLMRKPVRWPRLVQQVVTQHHQQQQRHVIRSPAPEGVSPQLPTGDDAFASFDRATSGNGSLTTLGAVARWKKECKSFPRLVKIESHVALNFLIGRKIMNLDQELVIQHDAREAPISLLQDPYALVIWEPPYLNRAANRFTLEVADNSNDDDGGVVMMASSIFASTTGVDSQPDLIQTRDLATKSSSFGGGAIGGSLFALPPSVFRRAALHFVLIQRAQDSSEDVLFLMNTNRLQACDGRITYVSNYEAFASSILDDSDLALGASKKPRMSSAQDFDMSMMEHVQRSEANLDPRSKHQATDVQIASFTSQATEIFIQFVFPWSMDISIVREALEMVAYKNTSVAPVIGPRHVKVSIESDYGVEEKALIVINVTARDDPTSWNIVGSTGVSFTLPIDQHHAANVLGEKFTTNFRTSSSFASLVRGNDANDSQQQKKLDSSPLERPAGRPDEAVVLWDYVHPPMIKFASSIDVIDDDTTFFSGGYLRIRLHDEHTTPAGKSDDNDNNSASARSCDTGSAFFDPDEDHTAKFAAFANAPLSAANGVGIFLDIPQRKVPFGLSMAPCVADAAASSDDSSLVFILYDDAWRVGTVRLCYPRGSIRRPVVSGINVVGGQRCSAPPSPKRAATRAKTATEEEAPFSPAAEGIKDDDDDDENNAEEQVIFACDILVSFDDSGTGATIDTIQELLRIVTFTSTLVRGREATRRRVSTVEMLVGATTARRDILGNELPDTKVNQPLRCAFFLEPRSCFLSVADASISYRENSGPVFLFDNGLNIERSFVGGYLRLDILDHAREAEDSIFVADRHKLIAASAASGTGLVGLNSTSLDVPLNSTAGALLETPRKLSMDVASECSETSNGDAASSGALFASPCKQPTSVNPIRSFSLTECCRVEPVVNNRSSVGVATAFELSSFAKVNMMTVQDVIEATKKETANTTSSPSAADKQQGRNNNNHNRSDSSSQPMSGGTATLMMMQATAGGRHNMMQPAAPSNSTHRQQQTVGGGATVTDVPSPHAVSKTMPIDAPLPLARRSSLIHNPHALIDSSVEAIRRQSVLGERQREIIERSTDHPSFQVTLASATSARRSSFRQLARQRSLRGSIAPMRSSPKTLIDHRIAEHVAQELVWANRMKRIMIARNSKFTYLLAKSCYKLVHDRKDHLAAIGLDVQLVQPAGLEEHRIMLQGTEVGTAIVKNDGLVRSVVIVFLPEVVITPETFNAVCRTIAFKSTSRNPHFLRKFVRVTLHVDDEGDSNILVPIEIQPYDDPTDISFTGKSSTLRWKPSATELSLVPRQFPKGATKPGGGAGGGKSAAAAPSGSNGLHTPHNPAPRLSSFQPAGGGGATPNKAGGGGARREGLGALQLFPRSTTILDDPDTTHWDGGYVEVAITRGFAHGLDSLLVFSLEQQLLLLGPTNSSHYHHEAMLVDIQPPFASPATKVLDYSVPSAVEAQSKVIQDNMQPHTVRTVSILRAHDRSMLMENIGTVEITLDNSCEPTSTTTSATNVDDATTVATPPAAAAYMTFKFHSSASIFERKIGLDIVRLVTYSIGFFSIDTPPQSTLVKSKTLSIKIADEDNIKNPGYRRIRVDCTPPLLFKPLELQKPILYTLKSAQEAKPELLFLGLQSKCYLTEKDKFPHSSVEVFPVSGFSLGDKLMIKPSGQSLTITQDGIVLLGKDMVARNLVVTPISIKFDVNKDCRGATWPKILQLLSVIAYMYDLKEATKNSGVGGRDLSGEALFPSADRIICLQVSELKAVGTAAQQVTSPTLPPSDQAAVSETQPQKRLEPFFLLQRISTTDGVTSDA